MQQDKDIDRVVSINDTKVLFGTQQVKRHWEEYFQAHEGPGDVVGVPVEQVSDARVERQGSVKGGGERWIDGTLDHDQ